MGASPSSPESAPTQRTDFTSDSGGVQTPTLVGSSPFVTPRPVSGVSSPEEGLPNIAGLEIGQHGAVGDDEELDPYAPPPMWAVTPVLPKQRKRSGIFNAIRSPLKELVHSR